MNSFVCHLLFTFLKSQNQSLLLMCLNSFSDVHYNTVLKQWNLNKKSKRKIEKLIKNSLLFYLSVSLTTPSVCQQGGLQYGRSSLYKYSSCFFYCLTSMGIFHVFASPPSSSIYQVAFLAAIFSFTPPLTLIKLFLSSCQFSYLLELIFALCLIDCCALCLFLVSNDTRILFLSIISP